MDAVPTSAGGWYPDVFRRHELRFYDGRIWTEHVSDRGVPGIDTAPLVGRPRQPPPGRAGGAGAPPQASAERARVVPELIGCDGDLLGAPLLIVDGRERAIVESGRLACAVRDQRGVRLGTVVTRREGLGSKSLRLITSDAVREVTRVDVLDATGAALLHLHRPMHRLKPAIAVTAADGHRVGMIVARKVFTRLCFTLQSAVDTGSEDRTVGTAEGDGPRDANVRVHDRTGQLVARVSRTWEVLARDHHPEQGTYIVQVVRPLAEPLRSLTLAALLALETMIVPVAPHR